MATELHERLRALHPANAGPDAFPHPTIDGKVFVALLDWGSPLQYGVVATADGEGAHGAWAASDGKKLTVFGEASTASFVELLEHPRREVEDAVEKRAERAGLPGLETAWSLPAAALIAAMLRGSSQHFARLALSWMLPTELRELRPALRACAENAAFPEAVRAQAARLVVPE